MSFQNEPRQDKEEAEDQKSEKVEEEDNDDDEEEEPMEDPLLHRRSLLWTGAKLVASAALLVSAYQFSGIAGPASTASSPDASSASPHTMSRRLQAVGNEAVPSYMDGLFKDLAARKKLFDDTPPEEVKYWFEYAGPLQVSLEERK